MKELQQYWQSCLEQPIEWIIWLWHDTTMVDGVLPLWLSIEVMRETIPATPSFDAVEEQRIYNEWLAKEGC